MVLKNGEIGQSQVHLCAFILLFLPSPSTLKGIIILGVGAGGNTRSLPNLKVEQTASLFRGWPHLSL